MKKCLNMSSIRQATQRRNVGLKNDSAFIIMETNEGYQSAENYLEIKHSALTAINLSQTLAHDLNKKGALGYPGWPSFSAAADTDVKFQRLDEASGPLSLLSLSV